jgi:signal transduction histidine kinase
MTGLGAAPLLTVAALVVVAAVLVAAVAGWREVVRLRERAARVAHEVRGPLTAAQLVVHGAGRRGELAPTLVAALELELRRAALALEEPDAGGGGAGADVDLHALLECQARTWREVAAAHGAQVTLRPGPGAAVVRADALRIAQATGNVVANAIEHGGGHIEISTRTLGERVRVEVSDGGPGLPASVAELGRRPRGRRGRGLAITTAILAAQGGRITTLPAAAGARLAIDLPAAKGTP